MNEHWRIKNNHFGIFTVKNDKASGWDKIGQIMDNYFLLHPLELLACRKASKEARETRKNKYASADNNRMRYLAELPVGLVRLLEKSEPMLFKDKKLLHSFLKKYHKLRVCQEI